MSAPSSKEEGTTRVVDIDTTPEARRATEAEHQMSFWQSVRTYPKAVGWSILFSTALVMEGYDNALVASLFAYGPFQRAFGEQQPDGSYQVTAAWQSGLTNGALVGEVLGLFATGIVVEKFGYRKSLIGALLACVAFIFIIFFAKSLPVLLVGEILIGIPWGLFQTVTTTYASEGVLKAMLTRADEWGYKIPFALQWMWPIPIAIGVALAPESPWWLVRKDRPEDARHALQRLTVPGRDPNFNADETIAMIRSTNELEKRMTSGSSYLDCFRGVERRRTEIVCLTWATQSLSGSALMGYSTYFYEQAGMATSNAFTMSMALYALGAIGTISSWPMMSRYGRRTLYVGGLGCMMILLLIIGFLGIISKKSVPAQWAVGSLLLIYTFFYDATVGPICYSLVSELSSTRLRTKTIVLARNLYNICGLITNIITPRMLNPSAWDWGAKAGFFWAGMCFLCLLWAFFRLPEPKGRTYAELDLLFEQRVPARKFSSTRVDPFANERESPLATKMEKPFTEVVEHI
ncbi:hypothetical protein PoHVEF18_008670 [Penicillium ochrochloron]